MSSDNSCSSSSTSDILNCANLDNLPDDVTLLVFSYLDSIKDILTVRCVCKTLNRVIGDEELWQRLFSKHWGNSVALLESKPQSLDWMKFYKQVYKKAFKTYSEYRIVIVGSDNVDKSSLAVRFVQGVASSKYDPTCESSYRRRVMLDGHMGVIEIMDTAGQEEYFALRDHYIKTAEGFVLLYSITSRSSFEAISKFRTSIIRILEDWHDFIPMILVGHNSHLDSERVVSYLEGQQLAAKFGIPFMEASAKLNYNVSDLFIELVRMIMAWRSQQPESLKAKKKRWKWK